MKAIGFFALVFLSMLTLFVVATGELQYWLAGGAEESSGASVHRDSPNSRRAENVLRFDFWNVELGRRSFTLRAVLPPDDLQDGSQIDRLEEIELRDGTIEIPLYSEKELLPAGEDDGLALKELRLEFRRAVYFRPGGLVKGGGRVRVVLEDGRGVTNEGTRFVFEDLLFTNESKGEDGSRFSFRSERPVSIVNRYLEVRSPSGLEGAIGKDGIDHLEFLPPVFTTIDPKVASRLALTGERPEDGPERPDAAGEREAGERLLIASRGPLALAFRRHASSGSPEPLTRIVFRDGVVVYSVADLAAVERPPPGGNRLECRAFALEIDDRGKSPVPRRAIATAEGDRVRIHVLRGERPYVLDGDRLEWINLADPAADGPVAPRSEGVLTGRPTLKGDDLECTAERAVLRPHEERVILDEVHGILKAAKGRGEQARGGSTALEELLGAAADAPGALPALERDPGRSGLERSRDGRSGEPSGRELAFQAGEVELNFASEDGADRTLTSFVARGDGPRGVTIRSRPAARPERDEPAGGSPHGSFEAAGQKLTYLAGQRRATLEGDPGRSQLPRLSQGGSWIEAERIHLVFDGRPQTLWFERSINARIDLADFGGGAAGAAGDGGPASSPENARAPRAFELQTDSLGILFDEDQEIRIAVARSEGGGMTRLRTLQGEPYRFTAPELRLLAEQDAVELIGGKDGPEQLAQMEMKDGVVRAGRLRFENSTRTCHLEDGVEIKLYRGGEFQQHPDVLVRAENAIAELAVGDPAAAGDPTSALGELDAIHKIEARGSPESPLLVRARHFEVHAERLVWNAEEQRLVFSGTGMQEIVLDHEELKGPVRARTITYDRGRDLLVLETQVEGELRQGPQEDGTSRADPARASGRPFVWHFETNVLEIALGRREAGGPLELVSMVARDKVLLFNREQAVLLRGDDLVYDHGMRRVKVFSRDGRRQVLQHFRDGADAWPWGHATGTDTADTIDAQEIAVCLTERPRGPASPAVLERMLVVQFRRDVMANFYVPGESASLASGDAGRHWQIVAQELTLHVDPQADPARPEVLPWAFATGRRPGIQGNVTIITGPYQAFAEQVEYRAPKKQLMLLGSPGAPATISERRPRPGRPPLREERQVILVSKPGETILLDYPDLENVAVAPPWPGIPDCLRD